MGEIAEMMLDGARCEQCGEFIDDGEECGYPRLCAGCEPDQPGGDDNTFKMPSLQAKVACPQCRKRVKPLGLVDHQRSKHGSKPTNPQSCWITSNLLSPFDEKL